MFLRAATWPDEVRRPGGDYDHPRWHYINYPLRPPKFREEAAPGGEDILTAWARCEHELTDRKSPPAARAVALAWLAHLAGDLHQPLHCASGFSADYPQGDAGGNRFWVKPGERPITLHSFWDELLGTRNKHRSAWQDAIRIAAEHSRKSCRELGRDKNPEAWSLASRALAVEQVYRRGRLKAGMTEVAAGPLPAGYEQAAKAVAERQAAVAGYRLADELNRWLK